MLFTYLKFENEKMWGSQSFELPSDEELSKIAAERADSNIDVVENVYRSDWGQTPKEVGIAVLLVVIVLFILIQKIRS